MSRVQLFAVAFVGAGLVVSGWSSAKAQGRPGVPPTRPGADLYVCPAGFTVAAYDSRRGGRVAFPRLHPSHPETSVRIARCFGSVASAVSAGYRLAPLPHGDAVVRGIYLLPTSADVRSQCRAAATAEGFAVPCPTLQPVQAHGRCPCVSSFGFLLMMWGAAPTGYVGDEPGSMHLVFSASRKPTSPWVSCSPTRRLGSQTIGRHTGTLLDCARAAGTNGGHVLFTWHSGGVTYAVSAHGHSSTNRALLRVLLAHLAMISPAP